METHANRHLLLCFFFLGVFFFTSAKPPYGFRDIPGNYCSTPIGHRCCDGRKDDCSFPILGTRCYCDQFCNRTINPDCCPDYWDTCIGVIGNNLWESVGPGTLIQPFPTCVLNGETLKQDSETKDNCNTCKCTTGGLQCSQNKCLIDKDLFYKVNQISQGRGWTVKNYTRFWGQELDEGLLRLTGTLQPSKSSLHIYPIRLHYDPNMLPKHFDARSRWPWARIGVVWDQGLCGASWAFSTASIAEDRLAIESAGKEVAKFSRQNLLSCNLKGQHACKGGHVDGAWNYLRRYGVVTDDCFPYTSGEKGLNGDCKVPMKGNLLATNCPRESFPMGRKEYYKTEPPYRIASNEEDIMWEIMTAGPVQAIMKVYQDFFLYGGGIYTREGLDYNDQYSHHSIKIFGWGEEPIPSSHLPQKYWLCMNSWGEFWGERGLFKIRRGTNETDIETYIITARARLADKGYNRDHKALTRRRRHRSRHNA